MTRIMSVVILCVHDVMRHALFLVRDDFIVITKVKKEHYLIKPDNFIENLCIVLSCLIK